MTRMNFNDRKKEMVALIEQGLKQPGQLSDCFALFHNYSLFNTLYVGFQQMRRFGNITPIRGFKSWNDLNRVVKKGEHGLEVCFPVFADVEVKDEHGNILKDANGKVIKEKKLVGFDFRKVHFAYSQTKVLDESKEDKKTENNLNFDWKLAAKKLDIEVIEYNSMNGNCQGYSVVSDEKKIAINPLAENVVDTAIHEMAHALMHNDAKGRTIPKALREVQAEMTSYICLAMLGADETRLSNARAYIQRWLGDNELTPDLANMVMNTANKIMSKGCNKKEYEEKQGV